MKPVVILLVDDSEPARRVLQSWLEGRGHRVVTACSGREALAVVESQDVDLVITDVLMPDGDGVELTRTLRKTRPHLGIIAISGGGFNAGTSTCLQRAQQAGAHALLLKPFHQDQLAHAMRYVLGEDTPNISTVPGPQTHIRLHQIARPTPVPRRPASVPAASVPSRERE